MWWVVFVFVVALALLFFLALLALWGGALLWSGGALYWSAVFWKTVITNLWMKTAILHPLVKKRSNSPGRKQRLQQKQLYSCHPWPHTVVSKRTVNATDAIGKSTRPCSNTRSASPLPQQATSRTQMNYYYIEQCTTCTFNTDGFGGVLYACFLYDRACASLGFLGLFVVLDCQRSTALIRKPPFHISYIFQSYFIIFPGSCRSLEMLAWQQRFSCPRCRNQLWTSLNMFELDFGNACKLQ